MLTSANLYNYCIPSKKTIVFDRVQKPEPEILDLILRGVSGPAYHNLYSFEKCERLRQYTGLLYPSFGQLIVDFDSSDGGAQAFENAKKFVFELTKHNINSLTFFSGGKGFHVAFPCSAIGIKEPGKAEDIKQIVSDFLKWAEPNFGVDTKVKSSANKIRALGSQHETSKLYKYCLNTEISDDFSDVSFEEIRALAGIPPHLTKRCEQALLTQASKDQITLKFPKTTKHLIPEKITADILNCNGFDRFGSSIPSIIKALQSGINGARFRTHNDKDGRTSGAIKAVKGGVLITDFKNKIHQKIRCDSSFLMNKNEDKNLKEELLKKYTLLQSQSKSAVLSHDYIRKKKLVFDPDKHKIFYDDGLLYLFFENIAGEVKTFQTISKSGDKFYASGLPKTETFFKINGSSTFALCEGFATGMTIHMATGFTVFCAGDASGMANLNIGARFICVDNDAVGVAAALTARRKNFCSELKLAIELSEEGRKTKGFDYNDYYVSTNDLIKIKQQLVGG